MARRDGEKEMKKSGPARILIIDDDKNIRASLATVLRDEGYVADAAESGQEAIKKSEANFYNLALVDLRLPDIDGIRLLTEIRETVPKMVKIIITGYPSLDNAIEAVNRGADGYMTKPYTMENLLNTRRKIFPVPEEFREVNNSLFVYGLPDFSSLNPRSPQVKQMLRRDVEQTIAKFEPRLKNIKVKLEMSDKMAQKIHFRITGILHMEPLSEPVTFDTYFDINKGNYAISQ